MRFLIYYTEVQLVVIQIISLFIQQYFRIFMWSNKIYKQVIFSRNRLKNENHTLFTTVHKFCKALRHTKLHGPIKVCRPFVKYKQQLEDNCGIFSDQQTKCQVCAEVFNRTSGIPSENTSMTGRVLQEKIVEETLTRGLCLIGMVTNRIIGFRGEQAFKICGRYDVWQNNQPLKGKIDRLLQKF